METQVDYTTNNTPVITGDCEIHWVCRWYHNGAAIAALILLFNTIALGWASLFIESSWAIKLMVISMLFAVALGAGAKGKSA